MTARLIEDFHISFFGVIAFDVRVQITVDKLIVRPFDVFVLIPVDKLIIGALDVLVLRAIY